MSVDMEGASQLRNVREIYGCFPEYWDTGKPRLEADVAAACEGLLAGGATDLVVLDNHGGNKINVSQESLPDGARLKQWHVFDLGEHGVDAMFQVGYHARGGVNGFLSHTYVPGLRLRIDNELISESHARAWAVEVPLLGIVGNDLHAQTLGSLTGTPFLVVQESVGRSDMHPTYSSPEEGIAAIRDFAEQCARELESATPIEAPSHVTFGASMPNGNEVDAQMSEGGWTRVADVEFAVELKTWREAREPIAAAMNAAMAPIVPYWLGSFDSEEDARQANPSRVAQFGAIVDAWAAQEHPEWYSAAPGS